MDRIEVTNALGVALTAALAGADLPRLRESEHGALIALRTTAIMLDLKEIDREITAFLERDREACGPRFCRDLVGRLHG